MAQASVLPEGELKKEKNMGYYATVQVEVKPLPGANLIEDIDRITHWSWYKTGCEESYLWDSPDSYKGAEGTWCPPIVELSKKYPEFSFHVSFEGEDDQTWGYLIKSGVLEEEKT